MCSGSLASRGAIKMQLLCWWECILSTVKHFKLKWMFNMRKQMRAVCVWPVIFCCCYVAQKDEVYLNLVLDYVPETVYRVARHFNKAKTIIPIIYVKVSNTPAAHGHHITRPVLLAPGKEEDWRTCYFWTCEWALTHFTRSFSCHLHSCSFTCPLFVLSPAFSLSLHFTELCPLLWFYMPTASLIY